MVHSENKFLFYSFIVLRTEDLFVFFSSHMTQSWNLNSNYCPGCRIFKFMAPLNAFATTWCIKAGIEGLTTAVSNHSAGHVWGLMSNGKECITYLWHSCEVISVGSIKAYGFNRGASIIHAYLRTRWEWVVSFLPPATTLPWEEETLVPTE